MRGQPARGDPPELRMHRRQADDDQAAQDGRRPGNDERVAEIELIDRNAESDKPHAGRQPQGSKQIQNDRHPDSRKYYSSLRILVAFTYYRNRNLAILRTTCVID
jgi:hypothetical protein